MFGNDIGIDLGTATVIVYVRGRGIVTREPSVVAIDQETGKTLAIGEEARRMLGKTPGSIVAVRPLKDGVIADYQVTETMLRYFIQKACGRHRWFRPRAVVCVPSGVTSVEKRAVLEACMQAGAREVYLISEPMAAAIGAGINVAEAAGSMVVDIGGGTTDIAVISLGGEVVSESLRVAGDRLDEAIVRHVKKVHNLMIGERTAEEVKIRIGSATPESFDEAAEVRGRDVLTGLPRTLTLRTADVWEAIQEPVGQILQAIRGVLERTPPELAADIIDRGIVLTGGGSLLRGLLQLLARETEVPVHLAEDPVSCVGLGTGKVLDHLGTLRDNVIVARRSQ